LPLVADPWQTARERSGEGAMDKAEMAKLRAHLRRSFGCDSIQVLPSSHEEDAADVKLGETRIGEIIADEEDGDRSFFFEMRVAVERPALQSHFRSLFENDKLTIASRMKKTDSVELNNGPDHIGVLTVDDDKAKSYTLEMAILDIDLDEV
jgi:hypothetical protein